MDYRVQFYQDDEYEVLDKYYNQVFKGSLADCEAWIRLTKEGYL